MRSQSASADQKQTRNTVCLPVTATADTQPDIRPSYAEHTERERERREYTQLRTCCVGQQGHNSPPWFSSSSVPSPPRPRRQRRLRPRRSLLPFLGHRRREGPAMIGSPLLRRPTKLAMATGRSRPPAAPQQGRRQLPERGARGTSLLGDCRSK